MPASEDVKNKLREILDESAKKYGADGIAVGKYSSEAFAVVLDSIADVALRAKKVVEENNFESEVDAIQFSGRLLETIHTSCIRTMQALAILLQDLQAKEAKKN